MYNAERARDDLKVFCQSDVLPSGRPIDLMSLKRTSWPDLGPTVESDADIRKLPMTSVLRDLTLAAPGPHRESKYDQATAIKACACSLSFAPGLILALTCRSARR